MQDNQRCTSNSTVVIVVVAFLTRFFTSFSGLSTVSLVNRVKLQNLSFLGNRMFGGSVPVLNKWMNPVPPLLECCLQSHSKIISAPLTARAEVAQSVQCLTTDWTIGVRSPAEVKESSSSLCVQTSSEAHPVSCTMGTGGPFPGGKAWTGHDADHSPHLVPRLRMSRSYTSSPPKCLLGL
jgi:hypothetical protein